MDINPYADHALTRQTTPARRYERVGRTLFFIIGLVISWVIWASWQTFAQRPQDATVILPDELRDDAPVWMRSAKARNVAKFVIIAAADARTASAQVYP